MTQQDAIVEIRKMVSIEVLLCQLAEECAELAQAALKLRRTMSASNPTPVTHSEAVDALLEEAADVLLCLRTIPVAVDNSCYINITIEEKADRWLNRLREVQHDTMRKNHETYAGSRIDHAGRGDERIRRDAATLQIADPKQADRGQEPIR